MYDTILFDFDGTLAPSLEIWLGSFQYALGKYDRTIPEETIIQRFFYREFEEVAREFDLPSGPDFGAHVHEGLMQAFGAVELYPGAREVLDWCRTQGLATGLVTSSPRPQVAHALSQLGLTDKFDAIVTGTDITNYKPHPEPVLLALKMLDRTPVNTLFIGDYKADILAGQAAGTHTALFLPPPHAKFYDFDTLRALCPTFEFDQWHQMQAHLGLHV